MERNQAFDILKGIGIIAVIIGHLETLPYYPYRNFIFAFHMPLFFIIAGYFYKIKPIKKSFKKDFKRLVIPYLFTSTIVLIEFLLYAIYKNNFSRVFDYFFAIFFCSGSGHTSLIWPIVPCVGPIWFLVAMFWCKTIYNYLRIHHVNLVIIGAIAILATIVDKYIINLPFCILPGISAIIFFMLGDICKDLKNLKHKNVILACAIITFLFCVFFSELSMVKCHYKYYPIDIIGACGGTYLFYKLSTFIVQSKSKYIKSFLTWFGVNSLIVLSIHTIELHRELWNMFHIPNIWFLQLFLKLIIASVGILVVYKFTLTRKVFCLNN